MNTPHCPSFIHVHSRIHDGQQQLSVNRDKPEDILIARLATDLLVWIDSAWIIGRVRFRDVVKVFGVFGTAGDPKLWNDYVDSMSICTGTETQACIDLELRRHNLATMLLPIVTRQPINAVLAIGPANRSRSGQYSPRDMAMIRELCGQIGDLLRAQRAEIGGNDLEIVRGMQDRLLPACPPRISGIECSAVCERAGELGGDFFELAGCSTGGLTAAIGNIEATGNTGCILMIAVQACLRSLGSRVELPELFSEVNRMFWEIAPEKTYATLFSARVYPARERLHYVNAGHDTSLIVRRNGRVDRLEPNAPVLGLSRGSAYRQRSVPFGPGDTLIALSEGMAIPTPGEKVADREGALIQMIRCDRGIRMRELPARVIGLIESIAGPQILDRTVVAVHFRPSTSCDAPRPFRKTVEQSYMPPGQPPPS